MKELFEKLREIDIVVDWEGGPDIAVDLNKDELGLILNALKYVIDMENL